MGGDNSLNKMKKISKKRRKQDSGTGSSQSAQQEVSFLGDDEKVKKRDNKKKKSSVDAAEKVKKRNNEKKKSSVDAAEKVNDKNTKLMNIKDLRDPELVEGPSAVAPQQRMEIQREENVEIRRARVNPLPQEETVKEGGIQEARGQFHESRGSASNWTKLMSLWEGRTARMRIGLLDKKAIPELEEVGNDTLDVKFRGNEDALSAYLETETKMMILDKGFDKECLDHPTVAPWVSGNKWRKFATHNAEKSHWELVREFVANMNGSPCGTTWIRGTKVLYDARTINELYDLEEIQGGTRFKELNSRGSRARTEMEKVTRYFTKDGSAPDMVSDRTLKTEMAPVLDFYLSKIRPGGNLHAFTQTTLKGIADLWQGKKFNMGEIIENTLYSKKNGKGVLCHPNLIRQLCDKAGVDMEPFSAGKIVDLNEPLPVPDLKGVDQISLTATEIIGESGDQSLTRKPPDVPKRKQTKATPPKPSKKAKTKKPTSTRTTPPEERSIPQQGQADKEQVEDRDRKFQVLESKMDDMSTLLQEQNTAIRNLERRNFERDRRDKEEADRANEINLALLRAIEKFTNFKTQQAPSAPPSEDP